MPIPVVAAFGVVTSVIGLIDIFLGRREAADLEARLEDLGSIRGQVETLGAQTLGISLAKLDTARDGLANLDSLSPQAREVQRLNIINDAQEGVNGVLNQTRAVVSNEASAEQLVASLGALGYAVATRSIVATELEAGPLGAPGIRDKISDAQAVMQDIRTFLPDAVERFIDASVTGVNPPVLPIPFVRPGKNPSVDVTATSEVTGNSETDELEISALILAALPVLPLAAAFLAARVPAYVTMRNRLIESVKEEDLDELGLAEMATLIARLGDFAKGEDIIGSADADTLTSPDSAGALSGDFIAGLGGDDTLDGGLGDDALRGDDGEDRLFGRDGLDFLTGGAGDDIIDGGGGEDTARFFGSAADYVIEGGISSARVAGPEGTDHLFDVETLFFDDRMVELGEGNLEIELTDEKRIALLYEAGLNRDGNIDSGGLNFWIDSREAGQSEHSIAFDFLESPEFTDSFGRYQDMSDLELVETLYRNVLNRDGETAGIVFWRDTLRQPDFDEGDLLIAFAISPENLDGSPFVNRLFEDAPGTWDFV